MSLNNFNSKLVEIQFRYIMIRTYDFWVNRINAIILVAYNNIIDKEPYNYKYIPKIKSFSENFGIIDRLTKHNNRTDIENIMRLMLDVYEKHQCTN